MPVHTNNNNHNNHNNHNIINSNGNHSEPIDCLLHSFAAPKRWHLTRTQSSNTEQTTNANQPGHNLACINIPLNVSYKTIESTQISYGLVFVIRFDNSLASFAKTSGLETEPSSLMFSHVVSISLPGCNIGETLEVWLSGLGQLEVWRRASDVILFKAEIGRLENDVWQFVYIGYEESEIAIGKPKGSLIYR